MKAWIIAAAVATLLSGCYEKDRIAALEKENQLLKARLSILEDEYPAEINIKGLLDMGRERLGEGLPDVNEPGFQTARSTLAGVISVEQQAIKRSPIASEKEFRSQLIEPLYALQDMWPANTSKTGRSFPIRLDVCKSLPSLYILTFELAKANNTKTASSTATLIKAAKETCFVNLASIVLQHKKKNPR